MYIIGVIAQGEDGGTLKKTEDGITATWLRKSTDEKSDITGALHRCKTHFGEMKKCCSDSIYINLSGQRTYDEELDYNVPKQILDVVGLSNYSSSHH